MERVIRHVTGLRTGARPCPEFSHNRAGSNGIGFVPGTGRFVRQAPVYRVDLVQVAELLYSRMPIIRTETPGSKVKAASRISRHVFCDVKPPYLRVNS